MCYFYCQVVGLNFSNLPCLKMAISKALGLAIVLGSSLVKLPQVLLPPPTQPALGKGPLPLPLLLPMPLPLTKLPQVMKIFSSGSATGISLLAVLLELTAISFSGGYSFSQGFPFRLPPRLTTK